VFRPFVEVNLIGPHLASKKRKYATNSETNAWSPKYNKSFTYVLGNEEEPDVYELHFCVKDYNLVRTDSLIGVAIMQLRDIVEQRGCACWCSLGRRVHMNETGWTILRILSQRNTDEVAKQFVQLKSAVRLEVNQPQTHR